MNIGDAVKTVLDGIGGAISSVLPPPSGRALPADISATMAEGSLWQRVMTPGLGTTPQLAAVVESTAGNNPPPATPVATTGDTPLAFVPDFGGYTMRPFGSNPFKMPSSINLSNYIVGSVADPEISADISGSTVSVNEPPSSSDSIGALASKFPWWLWLLIIPVVIYIFKRVK